MVVESEKTIPVKGGGILVRGLSVEVTEGPDAGKRATATAERLTAGTATSNDLVISDPTVSRYHLDLERGPTGVLVIDNGSTNGTLIGGIRVERAIVPPRTVLRLGHTSIRVDDAEPLAVEAFDGERLSGILGRSPVMKRLMARIDRAAKSDSSILLLGETGTGKEVIARAIHELSPRAKGPLETVDCGAMLPSLIASELFGHEKGAFTGADRQHIGAFERASGGTLFLDEIGELPASLQAALLGALERRSFRRLGGTASINVDVRVVSATHRDLRGEVNTGTFRQDLFYRLAVLVLSIPPLRDRREDIPLLAEHFVKQARYPGPVEELLTPKTLEQLELYRWPGNVRELRNVVEALCVMGEAPALEHGGAAPSRPSSPPVSRGEDALSIDLSSVLEWPYGEARNHVIERFEAVYLPKLLERCRDNVALAAREAKMNRSYLTKVLKRRRGESEE